MKGTKLLAVLLAAILAIGGLTACKKDGDGEVETYRPETATPIDDSLQKDYTDDADKLAYIDSMKANFTDTVETDGALFTVTETQTGVTVTGYTGTSAEVRIPEVIGEKRVTAIGQNAFVDNAVITKLYIPDSVTVIGAGALEGMTALRALRTPILGETEDKPQFLGSLFGGEQYADNGKYVPASLEYLELGEGMTVLADFALFECDDLICVTLPESMTTVGVYSFYHCKSLLAVNTEHLTEVAEHAFDSSTSLTRVELGASLTSIGLGAFEACSGLRTLTLPFVGGTATENTYLGYIFGASVSDFSAGFYPPYLTRVTILSGCTAIGDYAFYECDSLELVEIPDGVTAVGLRAFSDCVRLERVVLPKSLTSIGVSAFSGCLGLQSVEFTEVESSALTSIGINAFYGCGLLKSVVLGSALTSLPASCFAGCVSLESADLGGVTQVGKNAFYRCTRLKEIKTQASTVFEDGNDAATRLLQAEN